MTNKGIMTNKILVSIIILIGVTIHHGYSQKKDMVLDDFSHPLGEWFQAGDVQLNPDNEKRLLHTEGEGVFINGSEGRTEHLITKKEFGDVRIELEFMIPKGSNSGVYVQGRYEIQILDSWGKEKVSAGDCGGIYSRYDGSNSFGGVAPPLNASKEPGEWQHIMIRFKAPRFNANGEKIKNAVFKKVKLNGVTLHRNIEVTGPTRSSLDDIEELTGPLMLQGDHGHVAFRNIRIRKR